MVSKTEIVEAIAKSLREFGYPDASDEMIAEIWTAYERGDETMPHGVIGLFAENQLDGIAEIRPDVIKRGSAT
jgi:hypothetical protein